MDRSRRLAILLAFSALVSPAQAMAGCSSGRMDIPRSFGRDLSTSVLKQVAVGAVVAATAAAVLPIGAVGAVGVFAAIVTYRAILPSMRRASDSAFAALDHAFVP